jgi:hypothetical protein
MKLHATLAVVLATPIVVHAGTPNANPGIDFALHAGEMRTTFNYDNDESVRTTLRWIELSWYEPVTPNIEIGLHGGYSYLTQSDRTLMAGIEPEGTHIGIGLRATIYGNPAIEVFSDVRYTYRRLKHDADDQRIVLAWHEPRIQLGIASRQMEPVGLYAGAAYTSFRGEERVEGTGAATADFERNRPFGGFAGVELMVGSDGYVGIEVRSDGARGARIYFGTHY